MMKNSISTKIIVLLFTFFCQSIAFADTTCVIKGNISGTPTDSLLMLRISSDFSKQEREDTIPTKDGQFLYSIEGNTCRTLYIMAKPKGKERIKGYIRLLTIPGDTITINGTIDHPTYSGNEFYNELNTLFATTQGLESKDKENSYREYIIKNPDSDLSVYLLGLILSESNTSLYEGLTARAKEGVVKPFIVSRLEYIKRQKAIRESKKQIVSGKDAPDFSLMSINGDNLSLSSINGKYIVLDFWGSWCGWCIKGFPKMKDFYAKHKNRVEIIGVDCRDTLERWKTAVKNHQLPWKHVYVPKEDKYMIESYAVEAFPTKVIINPDKKIVKVFVGENDEFYDYLGNMLKE